MASEWPKDVELSGYVRDLDDAPMKSLVPPPIAVRVDQLVELLMMRARDLGDVSQGELVAALIQTAPTKPDELAARILTYRNARVHQTLLNATTRAGLHPLPARKIGRPKRSN